MKISTGSLLLTVVGFLIDSVELRPSVRNSGTSTPEDKFPVHEEGVPGRDPRAIRRSESSTSSGFSSARGSENDFYTPAESMKPSPSGPFPENSGESGSRGFGKTFSSAELEGSLRKSLLGTSQRSEKDDSIGSGRSSSSARIGISQHPSIRHSLGDSDRTVIMTLQDHMSATGSGRIRPARGCETNEVTGSTGASEPCPKPKKKMVCCFF